MFVFALLLSALAAPDARVLLEQARTALVQNRFSEARTAATAALRQNSKLGDAEIILGLVATNDKDLSSAARHFSRAVSLLPANPRARGYLAATYMAQGRFAEAAAEFRAVLKHEPANIAAQHNLGVIASIEGRHEQAIRYFQAALRIKPNDITSLGALLQTQLALKRTNDARATALTLQKILPPSDPRLLEASALLIGSGDYAGAVPILETVHRANPGSADAAYNLALALFRAGQTDRAVSVLGTFQADAQALNLLGAIEESRGRYTQALTALGKAARLEPQNESYRVDYAAALMRIPEGNAAVTEFVSARDDFPRSFRIHVGLGSAYYLAGEYEHAAATLLEALKLNNSLSFTYHLLGKVYEAAPAYEEQIRAAFRGYLDRKPNDSEIHVAYAGLLADSTNLTEARAHLEKALAQSPDLAEAHLQMGVIEQNAGDLQKAIVFYSRAVELAPELAQARYRLATALAKAGETNRSKVELQVFQRLRAKEREREVDTVVRALATQQHP